MTLLDALVAMSNEGLAEADREEVVATMADYFILTVDSQNANIFDLLRLRTLGEILREHHLLAEVLDRVGPSLSALILAEIL